MTEFEELTIEDTITNIDKGTQPAGLYKSKTFGYILIAFGASIILFIFPYTIYLSVVYNFTNIIKFPLINYVVSAMIFGIPTYLLIFPGLRLIKENGVVTLKKSQKNYTLYLREFNIDNKITVGKTLINWTEFNLKSVFKDFGSFVALGNSGEEMAIGGARLFVNNRAWQQIIYSLSSHARLIIINFTESNNVTWELKLCRKYCDPKKLLIYIEGDVSSRIATLNYLNISNNVIPDNNGKIFFIAFNSDWTSYYPYDQIFKFQPIKLGLIDYIMTVSLAAKPMKNSLIKYISPNILNKTIKFLYILYAIFVVSLIGINTHDIIFVLLEKLNEKLVVIYILSYLITIPIIFVSWLISFCYIILLYNFKTIPLAGIPFFVKFQMLLLLTYTLFTALIIFSSVVSNISYSEYTLSQISSFSGIISIMYLISFLVLTFINSHFKNNILKQIKTSSIPHSL